MRNDLASKSPHSLLHDFLIAKDGSCMNSIVNPILIIYKRELLNHAMNRK